MGHELRRPALVCPANSLLIPILARNLHAHDKAVSRLALQGDTLISADYHLKQWKLNGTSLPVLVQQFTGHAARITQLAVTPDGKHCLSTAEEDRYTCIWPLSSPSQASMTGNVGGMCFLALLANTLR